ncbi:MAG: GAF domain-containing protein [Blastochloris sp.]|nr:GAF domain-containing protein [Blastochloris sp.]
MIASDTILARARPWLTHNRRELMRVAAAPIVLIIAWWMTGVALPLLIWMGIVAYGIAHLALIGAERLQADHRTQVIDASALLVDTSFALLLLSQANQIDNAIYPLYLLLALRVLVVYQRIPAATIVPFVLGPAYLFAQALQRQIPPLSTADQGAQWSLLLGSLWFGAVAIWSSSSQRRESETLRQELSDARIAAELRVAQLVGTTNDLRSRMREQHALEEGLRVITSTLSLDDVLSQIVDSTTHMLGTTRVDGIALSFKNDGQFEHHVQTSNRQPGGAWASLLAQRAVRQHVPLIIADASQDGELNAASPRIRSALSVPLIVGDGPARGALTVVSTIPSTFSSSDARHLTAFAIQAGIAIGNAEMHSKLRRQQHLLSAVVRDISDGLVVIDMQNGVILTNPLAQELLDSPTSIGTVRDQLLALADSMYADNKATARCEINIGTEESGIQKTYHALASQVRQHDGGEQLVAIALHDVTAQKTEERHRSEFISMVAHELRNPLNSLSGFVKIVLQGRAGPLTPLQQEFLEIADGQAEQLKGRISELLEFNRLEAGRLVLNPQWNDMPLLVAGTVTRLHLQAEQAGLELANHVAINIPECFFDSERIGQVLTNLIENAIKATPPGGKLWVASELHEDEVWVRVHDTGVGIAPEDKAKIFQPFYRAHDRASSRGNHLGLGLAICHQIVEGHKGRLWVESELGVGSCFIFALPRTQRALEVGD